MKARDLLGGTGSSSLCCGRESQGLNDQNTCAAETANSPLRQGCSAGSEPGWETPGPTLQALDAHIPLGHSSLLRASTPWLLEERAEAWPLQGDSAALSICTHHPPRASGPRLRRADGSLGRQGPRQSASAGAGRLDCEGVRHGGGNAEWDRPLFPDLGARDPGVGTLERAAREAEETLALRGTEKTAAPAPDLERPRRPWPALLQSVPVGPAEASAGTAEEPAFPRRQALLSPAPSHGSGLQRRLPGDRVFCFFPYYLLIYFFFF